jgi:hypothetical protein
MKTLAPWLVLVLFVATGCGGDTKKGAYKDFKAKDKKADKAESPDVADLNQRALPPEEAQKKEGPAAKDVKKAEDKPAEPPREAIKRKIIYTAELSLVVEDLNKAEDALLALVDKNQGIVARSSITGSTGEPRQGRWRLRVPVERMRPFLRGVLQLGVPETNTTDSEDVTGRYYDLEATIKNYKAEEEALRKLLEKFTEKKEEWATLRRELRDLRGEIEKLQGEHKRLADLTALTTVNVTLREVKNYVPPQAPPPPTFGSTLAGTFSDSLGALVALFKGIVVCAVAVSPWLPLVALFLVPIWVIWRRLKRPPANEPPLLPLANE